MEINYKLFIFDFDGTLADTLPWMLGAANVLAKQYNFKQIEENEIPRLRKLDTHEVLKQLNIPAWKLPFIARQGKKLLSENLEQVQLFSTTRTLLKNLKDSGADIAIVSSNSTKNIKNILGKETLNSIAYVECGVSMFGKAKKINKVIKKMNHQKQHSIYIGDEIRDAKAANKIGVDFGAVSWGANTLEAFKKVDTRFEFYDMSEITLKCNAAASR